MRAIIYIMLGIGCVGSIVDNISYLMGKNNKSFDHIVYGIELLYILVSYYQTNNIRWLFKNIILSSLGSTIISRIEASVLNATILNIGMVVYDVMMVYYSGSMVKYFAYGEYVMNNNNLMMGVVKKYQFMMMMSREGWMLGMGDVIIPGILISSFGLDIVYTTTTIIGYVFGLAITFIISSYTGVGQPALLFIVPMVMGGMGVSYILKILKDG